MQFGTLSVIGALAVSTRGVRIHDVITKIYHMDVIILISGKICDKIKYVQNKTYLV
jgi:hypothetical protein